MGNRKEKSTQNSVNEVITKRFRLKCRNHAQKDFSNLITSKEITIASGPAGVGKSYVAIAKAIELIQIKSNQYTKIIICKPAVEAEEKLGFMPGDMREKMEPHVSSALDIIDKIIGQRHRIRLEEEGVILIQPLAFLRGKSIDNSIVIMEEAQNMSPSQMKTLLTRIGENTKFVISGDLDQSDRYKDFTHSGLYDAIHKHKNVVDIGFCSFTEKDIVRNAIISKILANYKELTPAPSKVESKSDVNGGVEVPTKSQKNKFLRFIHRKFKW